MTVFLRLLGGLSLFLLTCMLICGLWVRFHPQQDMGFHFLLGLAVVVSVPSRVMRKFVCRLWLNEVSQQ